MPEAKAGSAEAGWVKERIRQYWNRPETRSRYTSRLATGEEEIAWGAFFSDRLGRHRLRVLDVGTGIGFLALPLAELGHEVMGVDLSDGMIGRARERARERGLDIDFRIGDAEALSLDGAAFDAVVSRWVLWTLPHPDRAIEEWKRVVKPGGQILAFTSDFAMERGGGLAEKARRNLGRLMISVAERRNAWSQHYDKKLEENLPLQNSGQSSRIDSEMALFKECGLENVKTISMNEVNTAYKKRCHALPLRYRLISGPLRQFVCISGHKPKGEAVGSPQ